MYKEIRILAVLLCFSFSSLSQDLSQDLEKIIKNCDSLSSMSIEATVKVYSRKGGSVIYSTNAAMYRNANASFTKLGDQEYLISKHFDVTVDHDEKAVLILKKTTQKQHKTKKQQLDVDATALLKMLESNENEPARTITLVSDASGKRTYSITKAPGFKEVRMVLDMNELAIVSVTYEYSEESESKGQYISVVYTKFKKDANVNSQLETSNFFSETNGTYTLVSRLRNYKIFTEL